MASSWCIGQHWFKSFTFTSNGITDMVMLESHILLFIFYLSYLFFVLFLFLEVLFAFRSAWPLFIVIILFKISHSHLMSLNILNIDISIFCVSSNIWNVCVSLFAGICFWWFSFMVSYFHCIFCDFFFKAVHFHWNQPVGILLRSELKLNSSWEICICFYQFPGVLPK